MQIINENSFKDILPHIYLIVIKFSLKKSIKYMKMVDIEIISVCINNDLSESLEVKKCKKVHENMGNTQTTISAKRHSGIHPAITINRG